VQLLPDYDAHPVKHDHEGLKPLHLYGMRECVAAMRAVLAPAGNVHPQLLARYSDKPLYYAAHGNSEVVNLVVGLVRMPRGETLRIRRRFIWRLRWGRPRWCDHWPKYGLKGAGEGLLPVHTSAFSGYDQQGRDGEAFGENHAPWHAGEGSVREYAVAYGSMRPETRSDLHIGRQGGAQP
jgi:hypothetical protein